MRLFYTNTFSTLATRTQRSPITIPFTEHSYSRSWATIAAVLASLSLAACASQKAASDPSNSPPPELPEAGSDGEYEVRLPEPPPPEDRFIGLELGADLEYCNVESPKFFYDTAQPRPQDQDQIDALAECLNSERFKDTAVLLVGRADPRGSDSYNEELGQERAERIRNSLIQGGVDENRIAIDSRGEAEAKGDSDTHAYGFDRRVDVVQIGLVVEP